VGPASSLPLTQCENRDISAVEDRDVIQRHFEGLETLPSRDIIKYNKDKSKIYI